MVKYFNASETVLKSYDYDAFGKEVNASTGDTNPFRYAGQYYDTENGTYYLRARYYNPATGRFTQQDVWGYGNPGDPLSLNLYIYCYGDPVKYYDYDGHSPVLIWVLMGIAITVLSGCESTKRSQPPEHIPVIINGIAYVDPTLPLGLQPDISPEEYVAIGGFTAYDTEEAAAEAFYMDVVVKTFEEQREYAALIYTVGGKYYLSDYSMQSGSERKVDSPVLPSYLTVTAAVHTDPWANSFSQEDSDYYKYAGINGYVMGSELEIYRKLPYTERNDIDYSWDLPVDQATYNYLRKKGYI